METKPILDKLYDCARHCWDSFDFSDFIDEINYQSDFDEIFSNKSIASNRSFLINLARRSAIAGLLEDRKFFKETHKQILLDGKKLNRYFISTNEPGNPDLDNLAFYEDNRTQNREEYECLNYDFYWNSRELLNLIRGSIYEKKFSKEQIRALENCVNNYSKKLVEAT